MGFATGLHRQQGGVLPLLHEEILDWVVAGSTPAVIETTGICDAPLLALLERSERPFVVRLDAAEAEALRRIEGREAGRHLSDDLEANRRLCRAFRQHVVPHTRDLVVDTETQPVESIVASILAAVGHRSWG